MIHTPKAAQLLKRESIETLALAYCLARDPEVPVARKVAFGIASAATAAALSQVTLPSELAVVASVLSLPGLDEVGVVLFAARRFIAQTDPAIVARHRADLAAETSVLHTDRTAAADFARLIGSHAEAIATSVIGAPLLAVDEVRRRVDQLLGKRHVASEGLGA